MLDPVFQLK